jgi:uncharacterized protein
MDLDAAGCETPMGTSEAIYDDAVQCLRRMRGAAMDGLRIERLVVGVFVTGVRLSDGSGGVAYTPPELVRRAGRRILRGDASPLRGMTALPVAMGGEVGPFGPVIRLAVLNALSVPVLSALSLESPSDDDLIFRPLTAGRRGCMGGAMIPFIEHLLQFSPAALVVADRKHETLAEARGCTVIDEAAVPEALATSQTVIFTGATIPNGSLSGLLESVSPKAAVAVIGPTAGFVPEPLFARGVALVGTTIVTDADRALDILSEGGGMYPMFDCCMRKINLPHFERLRQLGLPVGRA